MRSFSPLLLVVFLLLGRAFGQVVSTQPAFPTADAEVTLVFDLKQAKDSRAKALLGKQDDVYLWSGAGTTETGNAFEFQPAGQTDFSKPFTPGKMTALGNDRWQIKLVPRTYYGVPAGRPIRRLGLLLKSGDGKAQTEDLFATIYDNRLTLVRLKPTQKRFYVDANATIPVVAVSSAATTRFQLTVDSQLVLDSTVVRPTGADTLTTSIRATGPTGSEHLVVLRATAGPEAVADTFFYSIAPQPTIAPVPTGLQDGINYTASFRGESRATLVLYAPKKRFVYVLGEFNNWTVNPAYLMNRTPDGNRYWIDLPNLPMGETAFQYLVDGTIPVGDPYADKILDRNNDKFIPATTYPGLKAFPEKAQGSIVSVLQPGQSPYLFENKNVRRPAVNTMVVYELLVRDFSASRTYQAVIDSLPYLKKLGINTIELMPVMEFSGNSSWGYNPIFYFAPDKAYGTRNDLKRLVDAAHGQGMAVVLDMVLNQADYEFPYVKMYWAGDRPSADSPYFNQQATHPFSVFFDFNHESPDTQAFVDRVCRYWLQEYKMDGFRFDLSKGFTQKQTGNDVSAWSVYDASRIAIWKRIYDRIRSVDPTAYVILEHFADNQEEKELADYGMLLWGNHNGDYRSATRTGQGDFSGISYRKRNFSTPSLIGYAESHDEERLVYDLRQNGQSQGSYNIKTTSTAIDRAKLAAAFMLSVPGPKMIWQFGELGYDKSINTCPDGSLSDGCRTDPKPVLWEYARDADRLKLYKVYAELIRLKTTVPAFATTDFTTDFTGIVKRLTLRAGAETVFLIGNFDTRTQTIAGSFPSAGKWYHYFSGQELAVTDPNAPISLEPGAFHLFSTSKLATPEAGLVPFAVPSLVTANEPVAAGQVVVSPNPADDQVMVDVAGTYRGPVDFTLSDGSGRAVGRVLSQKLSSSLRQPIDVQKLPAGLYFLRVQQGAYQQTINVLKR